MWMSGVGSSIAERQQDGPICYLRPVRPLLAVIGSNEVLVGDLPSRALKLVTEWASLHREELESDWQRAKDRGSPEPIDPLP
jgi:hypothetical protein